MVSLQRNLKAGIADRRHLPEDLVKDRFINGMPDNIRLQLMAFYGQPLAEVVEMSQNLLNVSPSVSSTRQDDSSSVNVASSIDASGQGLQSDIQELKSLVN